MGTSEKPRVVVTGAAGGIGFEVTQALLSDGYRVLAIDLDTSKLHSIAGGELATATLDIRDEQLLREAVAEFGRGAGINALVCCAAVYPAKPVSMLDEASWDSVFEVNVTGTLVACQACIPFMRSASNSSIVAFSSVIARVGGQNSVHYGASKGAILGLVRSLSLELAPENIRVNSVSPGLTDTDQPRNNLTQQQIAARVERIPLGRIGSPQDSVEVVRFLLSADASFVTGQDIRVTGGAAII